MWKQNQSQKTCRSWNLPSTINLFFFFWSPQHMDDFSNSNKKINWSTHTPSFNPDMYPNSINYSVRVLIWFKYCISSVVFNTVAFFVVILLQAPNPKHSLEIFRSTQIRTALKGTLWVEKTLTELHKKISVVLLHIKTGSQRFRGHTMSQSFFNRKFHTEVSWIDLNGLHHW